MPRFRVKIHISHTTRASHGDRWPSYRCVASGVSCVCARWLQLGRGEKDCIILMLTQPDTDYLVVDDRLAFVVSERMTVPKIWLVDLLVELVWQGCMERQLAEKMLRAMAPRDAPGFIPPPVLMVGLL